MNTIQLINQKLKKTIVNFKNKVITKQQAIILFKEIIDDVAEHPKANQYEIIISAIISNLNNIISGVKTIEQINKNFKEQLKLNKLYKNKQFDLLK